MTHASAKFHGDQPGGYVVRRPRVTDAVGKALRKVYCGGGDVPPDMASILSALDRLPPRH